MIAIIKAWINIFGTREAPLASSLFVKSPPSVFSVSGDAQTPNRPLKGS